MTNEELLEAVKVNLRLKTAVFDGRLKGLIAAAEAEVKQATGTDFDAEDLRQCEAVITYATAFFPQEVDERRRSVWESELKIIGIRNREAENG